MHEVVDGEVLNNGGERYARRKAYRSAKADSARKMRHFSISKQGKMIDCGFREKGDVCLVEPGVKNSFLLQLLN